MDIGKPVRIHNIPDPHRRETRYPEREPFRWTENPYFRPDKNDEPIPVPDWPVRKKVEVESE